MTRDEFVAAQTAGGGAAAERDPRRPDGERRAGQPRRRRRRLGQLVPRRARGERHAAAGRSGAADPPRTRRSSSVMATLASGILVGAARPADDRLADADGVLRAAAQVVRRRAEHDRAAHRLRPSRVADSAGSTTSRCRRPRRSATSTSVSRIRPTSSRSTSSRRSRRRGIDATVDPLFSSLASSNTLTALDLQALFDQTAQMRAGATISGPSGYGDQQFVPRTPRCRTPSASRTRATRRRRRTRCASRRCSTPDLAINSFRLGDIKIGGVTINVPADRAVFQGDFDLRNSLGFIVRVSAGVDPATRIAHAGCSRRSTPTPARCCRTPRAACCCRTTRRAAAPASSSWTAKASAADAEPLDDLGAGARAARQPGAVRDADDDEHARRRRRRRRR